MSALSLFLIEIGLSLCFSLTVIFLLRPYLKAVLVDTCGTVTRSDFWVMFTQIMLLISPLLIVIYFAPVQLDVRINTALAIKDTLFRSLLGLFIALAMIGHVIWKSIQSQPLETNSPTGDGS